jgi:hypothetical protein
MQHLLGWVNDPEAVYQICSTLPIPVLDTPEPTQETLLYEIYKQITGLDLGNDVQAIGDCVSWGWKHLVDITQAVQIHLQLKQLDQKLDAATINRSDYDAVKSNLIYEFQEASSEVIYALSRVEIGGNQIRGDGSVGAWAGKAVSTKGTLSRINLKKLGYDPNYSGARAREWGYKGLPDELEPHAFKHLLRNITQVRNFKEAAWHIQNGRPVAVCSNIGFDNAGNMHTRRDSQGFARPAGSWGHCMCFIGVRLDRPGLLCLNQWPLNATSGPKYKNQPDNTWWVDSNVVDMMLGQNDSFTGTVYDQYTTEKLNWTF